MHMFLAPLAIYTVVYISEIEYYTYSKAVDLNIYIPDYKCNF